jgi:RND family efflux transporter MFP subunit
MRARIPIRHGGTVVRTVAILAAFSILVILLMMWLAGVFESKIDRSAHPPRPTALPWTEATEAEVVRRDHPRTETATGTIRAIRETVISARLMEEVQEIAVTAGQTVQAGDVLMRLDDDLVEAQRDQAAALLRAAIATRDQAANEHTRVVALAEKGSATAFELEAARATLASSEAGVAQAEQQLRQAETMLSHAVIRAPMDGAVIDKLVEVGDTVHPGQPVMELHDLSHMQLVAPVRESLALRLAVGQTIGVRIDALDFTCDDAVIHEIVPQAEEMSRSFLVKVTGACPDGVYSGMFGKLLIPLDDESIIMVPRDAVVQVGQLRVVYVRDGDDVRRRAVRTGRSIDGHIEILSGLRPGEIVLRPASPDTSGAAS